MRMPTLAAAILAALAVIVSQRSQAQQAQQVPVQPAQPAQQQGGQQNGQQGFNFMFGPMGGPMMQGTVMMGPGMGHGTVTMPDGTVGQGAWSWGLGMPGGAMGGSATMGGGALDAIADPARLEGLLAYMKAELQITDAQSLSWNTFAEALRTNAKAAKDTMQAARPSGMAGAQAGAQAGASSGQGGASAAAGSIANANLPDRFAFAEARLSAHLTLLRAMETPTTQLYAALDDAQKQKAARLLPNALGMQE